MLSLAARKLFHVAVETVQLGVREAVWSELRLEQEILARPYGCVRIAGLLRVAFRRSSDRRAGVSTGSPGRVDAFSFVKAADS